MVTPLSFRPEYDLSSLLLVKRLATIQRGVGQSSYTTSALTSRSVASRSVAAITLDLRCGSENGNRGVGPRTLFVLEAVAGNT